MLVRKIITSIATASIASPTVPRKYSWAGDRHRRRHSFTEKQQTSVNLQATVQWLFREVTFDFSNIFTWQFVPNNCSNHLKIRSNSQFAVVFPIIMFETSTNFLRNFCVLTISIVRKINPCRSHSAALNSSARTASSAFLFRRFSHNFTSRFLRNTNRSIINHKYRSNFQLACRIRLLCSKHRRLFTRQFLCHNDSDRP